MTNFAYVGITNGIGAGIISRGRLYQDNSGFVGELGHTSVCFDGDRCICGNRGCLELYANMPVILNRLSQAVGQQVTIRELADAEKRPEAAGVLEDVLDRLTCALTNVANLLDPECIFMGHESVGFSDGWLEKLESRLNERILARGYKHILVKRSSFGQDAPLLGAAGIFCEELFKGHYAAEA